MGRTSVSKIEALLKPAVTTDCSGIYGRRQLVLGIAAAIGAHALYAPAVHAARRPAEIRRLAMTNRRTGEDMNVIYWLEGEYIPESLTAISHFMRDWRAERMRNIDVRTLDILAAVHNLLDTHEPFELVSGYRTAATNSKLRQTSDGVASNSLHVLGKAADIRLKGRSTKQLGRAALRCRAGGVGTYGKSGFVHVDCGKVRSWGTPI